MSQIEEIIKARINAAIKGSAIERMSEDEDVRQWIFMGRLAMIFCLWMAMILPLILLITVRF